MTADIQCVSYNILANAYARPDRYPQVDPDALKWEIRRVALERKMAGFDADILCLQEVEEEAYSFLATRLRAEGYLGVYAKKAQNRPDGCAVFFRQKCLHFDSSHTLHYHDGDGTCDSGHLALILSFQCDGGILHIADTHLKWDRDDTPQERHLGCRQIKELLQYSAERRKSEQAAWIVCGDFNAPSESPLVQELCEKGFRDAYSGHEQMTCNPHHKAKRIDYLFHTANLSARPCPIRPIEDFTPLPSAAEPSDHLAIMATFTFDFRTTDHFVQF